VTSDIGLKYSAFYGTRNPEHVYPVEFVVRAFLGNYPRLKNDAGSYRGQRVLDLGFGDGRNMPLLHNLGMSVAGVEISDEICQLTKARMDRLAIEVDLRVGRNSEIPFATGDFDTALACHACYYVDPGTTFADNLSEIARVLKPGGRFVFSAPMANSYIMSGAEDIGDGHMRIARDPYGIRSGSILKKFDSEADIGAALSPTFDNIAVGSCQNDFWGIEERVWAVVCRKTS
jgi:SAM-dependent methyltransferase